jgi:hypothetical protein
MSNESRYEDILRRIQERKAQEAVQPKQDVLAAVLDEVNALGVLEEVKKRPPVPLSCFGPKVFRKTIVCASQDAYWVGTVLWHKPRGYGQYQILGLLGIWALEGDEGVTLVVGTRQLAFSAPIFNPESYYHHMRRGFSLYYAGSPSPPDAQGKDNERLYETLYRAGERLTIRDAIEAAVQQWRDRF